MKKQFLPNTITINDAEKNLAFATRGDYASMIAYDAVGVEAVYVRQEHIEKIIEWENGNVNQVRTSLTPFDSPRKHQLISSAEGEIYNTDYETTAFNVETTDVDQTVSVSCETPADTILHFILDGEEVQSGTGCNFTIPTSGTVHTVEIVAQPSFAGVTRWSMNPQTNNLARSNLAGALEAFSDLEELVLQNAGVDGTLTALDLQGLKVIDLKSSFAFDRSGTLQVLVERMDNTMERMVGGVSNYGFFGDWSNCAPDQFANLTSIDMAGAGGVAISGTLADLVAAAPNVDSISAQGNNSLWQKSPITDLQGATSLTFLRGTGQGAATAITGLFADFDDPSIGNGLTLVLSPNHSEVGGEFGDLPGGDAIQSWTGDAHGANGSVVTYNNYTPSNHNNFHTISLVRPDSTYAQANVLPARAAREAHVLNAYPNGFFLSLEGKQFSNAAAPNYLQGWMPSQHPFRAIGAKPNVSFSLNGSIDTSAWNSNYAVASVDAIPSTSSITINAPTADGANDTLMSDGNPLPADSTLPSANGGSGALLHVFASSAGNDSGPFVDTATATEYVVSAVTDNGDGTLTIDLNTSTGPALTDTGAIAVNSNTRIVVTW